MCAAWICPPLLRSAPINFRARRLRSYLAAYSSRIDHKVCLRFMDARLEQVEQSGLPHGSSFDLDFHSVPANSAQEPLEKHYVSSRSRSQKGILVSWLAMPISGFCAMPTPV